MQIIRYTSDKKVEWDEFVCKSRNGTFLLQRNYMDYHADRFDDCSLMFYRENKLLGVMPGNWDVEERVFYSHQGLTYGGLLVGDETTTLRVLEIFEKLLIWLKYELKAVRMIYKPIPHIYHRSPTEEDLYALFRSHACLIGRSVASVISLSHRIAMHKGRKSSIKHAMRQNLYVEENENYADYWHLLSELLEEKYGAFPVHSLSEISLLHKSFPDNIRLFTVKQSDGNLLGGTVVYEFPQLVHAQYIAASPRGKEMGAIDFLYAYLLRERYTEKRFFDFGTSVERGGWALNEGLLRQKEAFGARAVMYDVYEINLEAESYG